jgi:hypothetical protein
MPHNYIRNFKWEKQVAIKTTYYEKLRVTANGNKLSPHVTGIKKKEFFFSKMLTARVPPKKCSENFKFPFHSGIFRITFHFKFVLNILLFY